MRKKKKKIMIIIFLIVLFIILFFLSSIKYNFLQEDLLFFQFFYSIHKSENSNIKEQVKTENSTDKNLQIKESNIMQIGFNVRYKDTQLKDVNLLETINNKTLVYEKIAPGTSGDFDIVLNSKEDINYEINFKSENSKPSNLQFYTAENNKRYATLEELDDTLKGRISENEKKIIHINWEWCYESSKQNNEQDTIEAKKIREYNFSIYVKGY